MNKVFGFLLLLMLLKGCTTKTTEKKTLANNDSIQKYLALAGNDSLAIDKRIKYNDKALGFIDLDKNDSLTREYLNSCVYNYLLTKNWSKYKKSSNQFFQKIIEEKDTLGLARYYRYKGGYFRTLKIYDSAFYFYLKSERLYIKTKDGEGLAKVNLSKSFILNQSNDYLGAEFSAKKAYSYFKGSKYHYDFYTSASILGNIYQDLKEYNKAILMLQEAISYVKKHKLPNKKNNFLIGACLNSIGNAYREQGNYAKAISYFKLALKEKNIFEEDPSLYGNLLNNLGYCYLKTKNKANLPHYFYKSKKIFDCLGIKDESAISDIYLSEFYIEKRDTLKANKCAERALRLAKEDNAPYYYLTALSNAGSINPKKAPKYIKEYHQINDSLLFVERNARNQYYKIQLETDEISQQKNVALKQRSIVVAIALILLFISVLIFIISRQRIKQRELKLIQTQQNANEEIYQLMLTQKSKEDEVRQLEKKRIGLELHDGIMNKLVSTRLNLSILSINRNETTIEKCLAYIKDIQNIEKEIRNVAHDLNQDVIYDSNSYGKLLKNFIEEQNKISNTNFKIKIDYTIDRNTISNSKKMNLYRIIQEASHNIIKHSMAKNAIINISTDDKNIYLSISDDGIGFNPEASGKGIGLKNMQHRVKIMKGKFSLSVKPNSTTSIDITIPLKS